MNFWPETCPWAMSLDAPSPPLSYPPFRSSSTSSTLSKGFANLARTLVQFQFQFWFLVSGPTDPGPVPVPVPAHGTFCPKPEMFIHLHINKVPHTHTPKHTHTRLTNTKRKQSLCKNTLRKIYLIILTIFLFSFLLKYNKKCIN